MGRYKDLDEMATDIFHLEEVNKRIDKDLREEFVKGGYDPHAINLEASIAGTLSRLKDDYITKIINMYTPVLVSIIEENKECGPNGCMGILKAIFDIPEELIVHAIYEVFGYPEVKVEPPNMQEVFLSVMKEDEETINSDAEQDCSESSDCQDYTDEKKDTADDELDDIDIFADIDLEDTQ